MFSDGSVDGTERVIKDLLAKKQIDQAYWSELRGGKSAGFNACCVMATGDIIINIDCDCSLDRDAILNIVRPFEDPEVGAVSGNIQVRNRFGQPGLGDTVDRVPDQHLAWKTGRPADRTGHMRIRRLFGVSQISL